MEQDVKLTFLIKAQGFKPVDSFGLSPQTHLCYSLSTLLCPKGFHGVNPARGPHLGGAEWEVRYAVFSPVGSLPLKHWALYQMTRSESSKVTGVMPGNREKGEDSPVRPTSPKRKMRLTHRHPPETILSSPRVGCHHPLGSAWILGFLFLKGALAAHLGQSPLFRTS